MGKTLYYAVNGDGHGSIFTSPPVRDEKRKIWLGDMESVFSSVVWQMSAEDYISLPALDWCDGYAGIEIAMEVKNAPCAP